MDNRSQVREFLTSRRARISPEQAGLAPFGRRRVTGHLFPVAETPHAAVYQLGSRVFNCHVSDNWGDANAHFRPGKGKIDWGAFLRSLQDVGFTGSL